MGRDIRSIGRCFDVLEADIVAAIATRETTRALLDHLASIATPNSGAAKILLVCARMATNACEWLDGDLLIEVTRHGERSHVDVATDLGGGLRERVFPTFELQAPFEELAQGVARVPHIVAPLTITGKSRQRLLLTASATVRKTSIPPPPVEISAESLFVAFVPPAPPAAAAPEIEHDSAPPLPVVPARAVPPPPVPVSEPPPEDLDSGWED